MKPMRMGVVSGNTRQQLCAQATTAVEHACLNFYCGSETLRAATPELNEAKASLKEVCGVEPACTAQQRGLDPEKCYAIWTKTLRDLRLVIESQLRVQASSAYTPQSREAVRQWFERQQEGARKTKDAIRGENPVDIQPDRDAILAEAALPALRLMRDDEVRFAQAQITKTRQLLALPCAESVEGCALTRKEGLAAADLLETAVTRKKFEIHQNELEPLPQRKVEKLAIPFAVRDIPGVLQAGGGPASYSQDVVVAPAKP
jgi:hypothetical protein